MQGLPADLRERISKAICRPEGFLRFELVSNSVFSSTHCQLILIQILSGGHLFRLERVADRRLQFFYSSPGTGTRMATIDLTGLPDFDRAYLGFAWHPEKVRFLCEPNLPGFPVISEYAGPSPKQFRIGTDGSVHQIGDIGIEVMGLRMHQNGEQILAPTAIEAWDETLKAAGVLLTGKSDEPFFQPVLSAVTLSTLVTGLEAYTKTRFVELEMEGIPVDEADLLNAFTSVTDRKHNYLLEMKADAKAKGLSVLQVMVNTGRINFQNYDHIKTAFRTAFGLKLGEIGIKSEQLATLQKLIRYRHRIVHVSPLLTMLNGDRVPPEEPVISNRELINTAINCFDGIIRTLHRASLELRSGNTLP